jgi:hypothetical protein
MREQSICFRIFFGEPRPMGGEAISVNFFYFTSDKSLGIVPCVAPFYCMNSAEHFIEAWPIFAASRFLSGMLFFAQHYTTTLFYII